jgi:hypothetical protein
MVPAGFVPVTNSANSLCLSPAPFSRLTTIRSLSASSPGFVLFPCVHGRFYEQQRPRAAELSFSLESSSRFPTPLSASTLSTVSHGWPQQLARVRLQGSLHFACPQPLFILEGERSRYEAGFVFRQQVVVCAIQSPSVVSGLLRGAEAQVAVTLIIVVFITFTAFLIKKRPEFGALSCSRLELFPGLARGPAP